MCQEREAAAQNLSDMRWAAVISRARLLRRGAVAVWALVLILLFALVLQTRATAAREAAAADRQASRSGERLRPSGGAVARTLPAQPIKAVEATGSRYATTFGAYRAAMGELERSAPAVTMELGGRSIRFALRDVVRARPTLRGDKLTLETSSGRTVTYERLASAVKETITLRGRPTGDAVEFDFVIRGLRMVRQRHGYSFYGPGGEQLFEVPNPVAYDRNGRSIGATLQITGTSATIRLEAESLAKADYPIMVDPTIVATASQATPAGLSINRHIVRASTGTLVFFYQSGAGLEYKTSADNGVSWSAAAAASSATSNEFCAVIANDNIYLTYTESGQRDVLFRRLTYSGGTWAVGPERVVESGGTRTTLPSVARQTDGRIWVTWLHRQGNSYTIRVRSSTDEGTTWSAATTLVNTNVRGSSAVELYQGRGAVIYEVNDSSLQIRRWTGAAWTAAQTIVSGNDYDDANWGSFTSTSDGRLHLAYAPQDGGWIRYTSYNGATWSAPYTLSASARDRYPSLCTDGTRLWALWSQYVGPDQHRIVYRKYSSGSWDLTPRRVTDPAEDTFAKVWLYSAAGSWLDRTQEASSTTAGDVSLFTANGAMLYVGQPAKFDYTYFDLQTFASSSVVPTWEYWNGAAWQPLTLTENTAYGFTSNGHVAFNPPAAWQARSLNGSASLYYVRVTRTEPALAVPPVANQFTSVRNNLQPTTPAVDATAVPIGWSEGVASPYTVRFAAAPLTDITLAIEGTYDRDGTFHGSPPYGVDFGDMDPDVGQYVTRSGGGLYAVGLRVTSDAAWGLTVQASDDLKNASGDSVSIGNLRWAFDGTAGWNSFVKAPTTGSVVTGQAANFPAGSVLRFDYQMNVDWLTTGSAEPYGTTLIYTAMQGS